MSRLSRLVDLAIGAVAARPWITVAAVLAATLVFGGGFTLRAPQAETGTFLPSDSDAARAAETIDELFGGSSDAVVTTFIFRGDALSPAGLAQMDELLDRVAVEPGVAETLTTTHAIVAPTSVIGGVLGADGFETVTQAQINSAIEQLLTDPGLIRLQTALLEMTGNDSDGTLISVATIRLRDTGDDLVRQAQLRIHELAESSQGPLVVGTVSPALIEQVYQEATGPGLVPLMVLAVLVVSALMLLFMRSGLDLLLTLMGLGLALVWTLGAEGWLGPRALNLIGPPNAFGAMVPIVLIGLAVDYVIQSLSRYREYRISGEPVPGSDAGRPAKGDHPGGAGGGHDHGEPAQQPPVARCAGWATSEWWPPWGWGSAFVVMLTFVPAVRTIIDRRREERGALRAARPISDSLPGVGWAARLLGKAAARWPVPLLAVVAAATIGFGLAAASVTTDFSHRDLLPGGGNLNRDLDTLRAAVGGSTEVVDVLVKAEITEPRTLFNLVDLTTAFDDNLRRPRGAVSGIQTSPGILVVDWITDDGTPGDRYDPELEALFNRATAGLRVDRELVQEFIMRMKEREPDELARVLAEDSDGVDTMLLQFQAFTGDQQRNKMDAGGHRGTVVRGRRGDHRHLVGDPVRGGQRRDQGDPDPDSRHDHRGGPRHPHALLQDHHAPVRTGRDCGGARRRVLHLDAGHHGVARHPLHHHHFGGDRPGDRRRCGLHDSHHLSVPGGIRAGARSRRRPWAARSPPPVRRSWDRP